MINVIITRSLNLFVFKDNISSYRILSTRKLKKKEILFARRNGLYRFYLPCLSDAGTQEFFTEFDRFWDQVIAPFKEDHPFWRNGISSKMQEWERSAGQLLMTLFTLSKMTATSKPVNVVFICSSIEEENICEAWAKDRGWNFLTIFKKWPCQWSTVYQELSNGISFVLKCIRVFIKKTQIGTALLSKSVDSESKSVLFISAFYDQFLREEWYDDPFFGTLHRDLEHLGYKSTYLNGCLSPVNPGVMRKIKQCREAEVMMPLALLTVKELASVLLRLFCRRINVESCFFMRQDCSSLLNWNARRFCEGWDINSEIYYEAVRKLCRNKKFERVFLLFEGNVQERASIQAVRQVSSAKIVAYSHGVIFASNLKLRLTECETKVRPEADYIVSTGEGAKVLLSDIGKRAGQSILSGCSLRSIPSLIESENTGSRRIILVALDGFHAAVNVLEWIFECAEYLQAYEVRLRCHPNVPLDGLLGQCIGEMPRNFSVSDGRLGDDIGVSFCVLYRHTSIGMQAILNKIPAVHLAIDSPLSADPIEGLQLGKWVIRDPKDFPTVLDEINRLDKTDHERIFEQAKGFVENYFTVPTKERLNVFIQ